MPERTPAPALVREALYLSVSGQLGGAERCLLSMLEGLTARGWSCAVVVAGPGPLPDSLRGLGVEAIALPMPEELLRQTRSSRQPWSAYIRGAGAATRYYWLLRQYLASRRPAVLHSNGLKMHLLTALLPARLRRSLVWHLHDFPPAGMAGRLLGVASRRARLLIANSSAVRQAWLVRYPRLEGRIEVVHNAVSAPSIDVDRAGAAFRQEHGLAPHAFLAGMVAVLAPWKGHEVFLEAARLVHARDPEVRFAIIGGDVYDTAGHGGRREALQRMCARLGLNEIVTFIGFQSEGVEAAYCALDVLVHASTKPEPFGRTIIEAMAVGRPVIAANAGGVPEIVREGVDGLLTPSRDAEALAEAILRLAHRPVLRQSLSHSGLERVRSMFSITEQTRRLEEIYLRLQEG